MCLGHEPVDILSVVMNNRFPQNGSLRDQPSERRRMVVINKYE